ncbi:MAG: metallophosphoesterase [Methanosarcinaceae archaeon]|nr:metallophosphoesterase [Methanosarcinaceae archaeon]
MIGIMSDSHDNLQAIKDAVSYFNNKGVAAVLHAGDLVSPFNARAFEKLDAKLYLVFGNNDGDRLTITAWFEELGGSICGDFADLSIDGLHIAMLHGINEAQVHAIAASGDFDVVVRGHTHDAGVTDVEGTLVINPGESSGVLTGRKTVAVLDPSSLECTIVEL